MTHRRLGYGDLNHASALGYRCAREDLTDRSPPVVYRPSAVAGAVESEGNGGPNRGAGSRQTDGDTCLPSPLGYRR